MRKTQQSDVIERASDDKHFKAYGRNFKPLIAAGSWVISGFHYGRSKCACCGRPIRHVLHLKNESHEDAVKTNHMDSEGYPFPEEIEIGIVCGPKVFTESCIGFYDDPEREWERQIKVWKDYINYIVLCVKGDVLWKSLPPELTHAVDDFLKEGYQKHEHTGPWWLVRDAKSRLLRHVRNGLMPDKHTVWSYSRGLVFVAKRLNLLAQNLSLNADIQLVST